MLKLKGEDDLCVHDRSKKNVNKHTLPEIQNDILKVMAVCIVRDIATCLQLPPFIL